MRYFVFGAIFGVLATIFCGAIVYMSVPAKAAETKKEVVIVREKCKDELNWNKFTLAIAQVESERNPKAFNKRTNAAGYLQIRKSVVDDCNRILGRKKYTMNDRFNKQKSIEMFNIIQNHYNKDKDFHFALKVWNPKSSFAYHSKVLKEYERLIGKKNK